MRLFVAVWPPPEVGEALRAVPHPERSGISWTPEESWHTTLRFLGEVPHPDPVVKALRSELPGRGPRPATLGEATDRLGSVLVVPVGGLRSLSTLVRLATSRLGDPPRPDPFEGHITVARGRRGVDDDLVGLPVKPGVSRRWSVDEVALVRSTIGLTQGPPRYETLETVSLL